MIFCGCSISDGDGACLGYAVGTNMFHSKISFFDNLIKENIIVLH